MPPPRKPAPRPAPAPTPSPSPGPAPKPSSPPPSHSNTRAKDEVKSVQVAQAKKADEGNRARAQDIAKQQIARDVARASTHSNISKNPAPIKNTGGSSTSGAGKIQKPFTYTGNDPAPGIDRMTGGGFGPIQWNPNGPRTWNTPFGRTVAGGKNDGGDPDPGPSSTGSSFSPTSTSAPPSPVLIPGRDALNFATSGVIDALTSFIFEDLGGTEIITLMKRDTIDGIDPNYSIISNISDARRSFDPTGLLSRDSGANSYFDKFGIQLLDKIPDDEYLTQNQINDFYYIASNGDLVIELDNLTPDERIDVEIATSGTINELDNS